MSENLINFDDFLKVDLRVVTVLEAKEVPESNKLLRLMVDVGDGQKRQIIAGIKKYYSPEELIGKQIIIVANLEPKKLAGLESQGMLLAAHDEKGKAVLVRPDKLISAGSKLG